MECERLLMPLVKTALRQALKTPLLTGAAIDER